jgi:endonuclease YncB( thermonuclease family)
MAAIEAGGAVRRIGPFLLAFLLFLSAAGTAATPAVPSCPDGYHDVTAVLNGSSFEITGGIPVRLIGVAVPEGEENEARSRKALADLLGDGPVFLEHDVLDRDGEGFFLRYAFADERFVNGELIRRGVARFSPMPPDGRYDEDLRSFQKEADGSLQSASRDSDCASDCHVYVGTSGSDYHVYGCSCMEGIPSRICRDEAVRQGYTACPCCGGYCDEGDHWGISASCFLDALLGGQKSSFPLRCRTFILQGLELERQPSPTFNSRR